MRTDLAEPIPDALVVSRVSGGSLDDELVDAVVRGDVQAFRAVWERYAKLVRRVLSRSLGADPACDDLMQEVFLAFLQRAKSIHQRGALRAYLVTITVRLITVELRRRAVRRAVMLSDSGSLPDSPLAARDFEGREALRALSGVLDKLDHRRRLAFVLRHVEGYTLAETAVALGVSESTAKRHVARGTREVIAGCGAEPALRTYAQRLTRNFARRAPAALRRRVPDAPA